MTKTRIGVMWSTICVFAVVCSTLLISQQQAAVQEAQFEVAAIKPADPRLGDASSTNLTVGRFSMTNVPLRQWVKMGFGIQDYALKGPSWIDNSRFDLEAKISAGSPLNAELMAQRMKNLLRERFAFKWHLEIQNVSGYELHVGPHLLLKPSGAEDRGMGHGQSAGPSFIGGHNMSMPELAEALGQVLGRPVSDATNLKGYYDVKLMWMPTDEAVASEEKRHGIDVDNLPSSAPIALKEQLGMQLRPAQVSTKVVVVDRISREPTAN